MSDFIGGLTEDQIETSVSRMIDGIDAAFMARKFDQKEYDKRIKEVNAWSEKEYRFRCNPANRT